MQRAKLGNLWVSVSAVANSVALPFSGNTLRPSAFACLAQSPQHLIISGIMSDCFRGAILDSYSSYKSAFFLLLCAVMIYRLDYTIYVCHTPSMLDWQQMKHWTTLLNHHCVVSYLLLLWFSFSFGTKSLLSLSPTHHFHCTSSVDWKRWVELPAWHSYLWPTYCPPKLISLSMTGTLHRPGHVP